MEGEVLVRRREAIAEIRLNRPSKKNALTNAMYAAVAAAIEDAESDATVRAILLGAEGDMFCAGNDLTDFAAFASGGSEGSLTHALRFLKVLAGVQKPLIAAVAGDGVGVGATMLLHCDVVVIAEDAKLCMPFTNLGLTPEAASSLLLPALAGHRRAFAMLALGEAVNGAEAARLDIATVAVHRAEVEIHAMKIAAACCTRPPEAVRITKRLLKDTPAILARIEEENAHFKERLGSAEARAAFEAFFKR
jgi:enoyl-CoA hydratase/carnithine racemase